MRTAMRARGFSLIELMIALAIFALLVVLAGPMYAEFIANTNIRNAGESMLNGVRLAQAQAVRSNLDTLFQLKGTGWSVTTDDPDNPGTPLFQEDYALTEGATQATITETPTGATTVTFGGLGRIICVPADCSTSLQTLDIAITAASNVAKTRPLRVVVANATGGILARLCDPDPNLKLSDPNNPQLCP